MTKSNRITLEQAEHMPIGELIKLPTQHLILLLEDIAALNSRAKLLTDTFGGILREKFEARAVELRRAEGKDTGTVRFEDDEMIVIADLPKKVEWDQAKLRAVLETIKTWEGENPDDYISVELKVPEKKFTAWPASIKKLFEAARTVSPGKPSYKFERVNA
jgi:hypothetical protein